VIDVKPGAHAARWRRRLHEIIFEADTRAGRAFDVALLVTIVLSVLVMVLESVRSLRNAYGPIFLALDWLIEEHGFVDIPTSIYWAIVTLTTVGYGDLAPVTPLGKTLASVVMLLGYGILAVPTGIVTVELQKASHAPISTQACTACGRDGHDADAVHCKFCGVAL
jgi:voltage-gated potassium channel